MPLITSLDAVFSINDPSAPRIGHSLEPSTRRGNEIRRGQLSSALMLADGQPASVVQGALPHGGVPAASLLLRGRLRIRQAPGMDPHPCARLWNQRRFHHGAHPGGAGGFYLPYLVIPAAIAVRVLSAGPQLFSVSQARPRYRNR